MSTTSPTAPVGPPSGLAFYDHVRAYTDQVRAHLADLRPDQVEELTDGLEADLAEAVVDAPGALPRRAAARAGDSAGDPSDDDTTLDLAALFGAPADYAAELRAAAGLGPVAAPERRPRTGLRAGLRGLAARLAERWRHLWRPVTSTPQWASFREFCAVLTPAWWILRGWLVATVLLAVLGGYRPAVLPPDAAARLFLLALVVVSVQWGRGRWLPLAWMPRALRFVSAAALVIGVPLTWHVTATPANDSGWDQGYSQGYADGGGYGAQTVSYGDGGAGGEGVWVDGMQVSNLFVYDAAGTPVRDVQIFDDRGRPVRTVSDDGAYQTWAVPDVDGSWFFQPAEATDGRERWNVYPLRAVEEQDVEFPDDGDGRPLPPTGVSPSAMPWPFLQAPTAIGPAGEDAPAEESPGDATTGDKSAEDKSAEDKSADGKGADDTKRAPAEVPSPTGSDPSSGPGRSPVVEAGE